MKFDDAFKAVREATDGTIAVTTDEPADEACLWCITKTNFAEVESMSSPPMYNYALYRPVPVYTVESVVGKPFQYHEAVEIKKQLGDAVDCVRSNPIELVSPINPGMHVGLPTYTFRRREVTEFTAICDPGTNNAIAVLLPPGAKRGTWKLTATWESES